MGLASHRGGVLMSPQVTVADRILAAVQCAHDCTLEDLVEGFSDLSWAQVFLEVDRLSRSGQLRLTKRGVGSYTITLRAM